MPILKVLTFATLGFIANCAFSVDNEFMGCTWHIPDRFQKSYESGWESSTGDHAVIMFTDAYFDEDFIKNRVSSSRSKQAISQRSADNGYEMIFYSRYIEGQEDNYVTSWVVIRNLTDKGTFYMSGLELGELQNFVSTCMPNLQ